MTEEEKRHLGENRASPLVRHLTFQTAWNTLENSLREQEEDGFALLRVVPLDIYRSVAVFVRVSDGDVS